jgi:tetratricopeptide (TPR) repeat protein
MGAFETVGTDPGRAGTGIAYLEETVQLQEKQYEEELDPRRRGVRGLSLAQTLMQVGRHHHQQADPPEAILRYERAIELVEAAIADREESQTPTNKRTVAYARFMLSELCSALSIAFNDKGGREDEALKLMQRALKLRKDTVGKTHGSLAECYNNLGALYFARGSMQRSVEHYEQAFDMLVEASGGKQEGPHVALTLYNIGVCRNSLGQLPEAATALMRAEKLAEASLGTDHPQVNLIKQTIAVLGKPQTPGAE